MIGLLNDYFFTHEKNVIIDNFKYIG